MGNQKPFLAGGFRYFLFSPRNLGEDEPNLTIIFETKGLVKKPTNFNEVMTFPSSNSSTYNRPGLETASWRPGIDPLFPPFQGFGFCKVRVDILLKTKPSCDLGVDNPNYKLM